MAGRKAMKEVRIDRETWELAQEAARKLGRDPEELVAEAVREHLERIMEKLSASHGHGA